MTEAEWTECRIPSMIVQASLSAPNADRKGRMLAIRCLEHLRDTRSHGIDAELLAVAERKAWNPEDDEERLRAYRSLRNGTSGYSDLRDVHHALLNWSGVQAGLQTLGTLGAGTNDYRRTTNLTDLQAYSEFARDIFGNPFRPISFSPEWRTSTVVAIAKGMYDSRDFGPMPLLADALQDAGCEAPEIIDHCRGPGPHVRGCWVVDGVLGKT